MVIVYDVVQEMSKIKAFRRVFRGVKDKAFFLFRVCKLYA